MENYEKLRESLRDEILEELDFAEDVSDARVLDLVDQKILQKEQEMGLSLSLMKRLRSDVFHSIRRLDVLQDLLEDPEITEIMINGARHIFVEKHGRIEPVPLQFSSEERLRDIVQQMVAGANRTVSEAHPIADARLRDGSRVSVVLSPAALNGPIITIRRFPEKRIVMEDLIRLESISREAAAFLFRLTKAGYNIFISGGTGSGKTTFLNALSDAIPAGERIITIEDNAELQITHLPNLVRLEARQANVEGCEPISIRDLIRAALRMRPDRIIVGEVRGEEAIDMLNAMNTGHDGSMSTGHANSAKDMMARLETMVQFGRLDLAPDAVRSQIASAIDIVVHLGRLRDGSRRVLEIAETDGAAKEGVRLRTLYRFREEGETNGRIKGTWQREGTLLHTEKLEAAGLFSPEGRAPP